MVPPRTQEAASPLLPRKRRRAETMRSTGCRRRRVETASSPLPGGIATSSPRPADLGSGRGSEHFAFALSSRSKWAAWFRRMTSPARHLSYGISPSTPSFLTPPPPNNTSHGEWSGSASRILGVCRMKSAAFALIDS
ncbi:hypothetical protein CDD83_3964 [Cordyceps sp. RAO-2017]|nr:hypothetical protein CDD83_3964 [Cordyceps sp. RAO-2017]